MIRIFHHYVSKMAFMLLVLELAILLAAAVTSAPLWLAGRHGASGPFLPALAFALIVVLCMGTLGMYQPQSREDIKHTLLRILPSFALGFGMLNLLVTMVPGIQLGRAGGLVFLLGAAGVVLARLIVFTSAQSNMMEQRLILVGAGAIARECLELAGSGLGFHQFKVVGCLPVAGESNTVPAGLLLPDDQSLLALARRYDVDEIVVSVSDRRNGAFPVRQLLECALEGLQVTDAATFFEREACQIRVDSLQPSYRNSRLTLRISIISSTPRLAAYTAPDQDQARGSPSSPNSATRDRSTEPTRSARSAVLGSCGA